MRRRYQLAPEVRGYALNEHVDYFSVIEPEGTTNIIANPKAAAALTGYTGVGAVLTRTAIRQRRGVYCVQVASSAATGRVEYDVSLSASTVYTWSLDVWAQGGRIVVLRVVNAAAQVFNQFALTGNGRWQRARVTFTTSGAATYTLQALGDNHTFFVDGYQVEEKDHDTTYCDGDLVGAVSGRTDFYWTGTGNGSASIRIGQCRIGGRVVNFREFGLRTIAILGLGLGGLRNVTLPNALLGGSTYQRTVRTERTFSIVVERDAYSLMGLLQDRGPLEDVLAPEVVAPDQPLVLRWQYYDDCGDLEGAPLDIMCLFEGGMEGRFDNHNQQRESLNFKIFAPAVATSVGNRGADLDHEDTVDFWWGAARREDWAWGDFDVTSNGTLIHQIVEGDSYIYVVGTFTNLNGIANADYVARYDKVGGTWSALSTGANAVVFCGAIAPNGDLYVGGDFTSIGGVAADRLAVWNGTVWAEVGGGANAIIRTVAFDSGGNLYVGGYLTLGGATALGYIGTWDGSAWDDLDGGMNQAPVLNLAIAADGTVYAGGDFTQAGGNAANLIAQWNGTAWSALGNGLNGQPEAIGIDPSGLLYVAGDFTLAGSNTVNYVAVWNGTAWSALNGGANSDLDDLTIDRHGNVYVVGTFTTIGDLDPVEHIAMWNGTVWVRVSLADFSTGATIIFSILVDGRDNLYAGLFNVTPPVTNASVAAQTTVTVGGSAPAYPVVTFTGPGVLYSLRNVTTDQVLYFDMTINAGETVTLTVTPSSMTMVSSFQGNVTDRILPGSSADFFLQSGANDIFLLIADDSGATNAEMEWQDNYISLSQAVR